MPEPIPAGSLIAIYAKPGHTRVPAIVAALEKWLRARSYTPVLEAPEHPAPALAVVLGGDGTMLHVAHALAGAGTPIFAVHLGTLGFLNETALEEMYPSLETLLRGGGVTQERALLRVELEQAGKLPASFDVLNEAVVGKSGMARLLPLDVAVDGEPLGRYRADGVLIATPTGSTAYNLSAGGPVLHPDVAALLITPICPHALSQRPLAIPATAVATLTVAAGAGPASLTLDGQQGVALEPGDRVTCSQSPLRLRSIAASAPRFYAHLRGKLGWWLPRGEA